jgi:hypothetical protein
MDHKIMFVRLDRQGDKTINVFDLFVKRDGNYCLAGKHTAPGDTADKDLFRFIPTGEPKPAGRRHPPPGNLWRLMIPEITDTCTARFKAQQTAEP